MSAALEEREGKALSPAAHARALRALGRQRGRPLALPILLGGPAEGAHVRLADGRRVLDWIGGIGVYAFGHGDRDLLAAAAHAAAAAPVFQGLLLPGLEQLRLGRRLLKHAGAAPRATSGSRCLGRDGQRECAEADLAEARARRTASPSSKAAFAGRTTTLAELTDKPAFREGLPLRGIALHVPFFDAGARDPVARSVAALDAHLARHPGQVAAMLFELVQGEAGIRTAPREFFAALMERCRAAGVAVWVDEVQTYARTGELFAHRTLGLEEYVDVVTVGRRSRAAPCCSARLQSEAGARLRNLRGGDGRHDGRRAHDRATRERGLPRERRAHRAARAARASSASQRSARAAAAACATSSGIGAMWAFAPFDGSPGAVDAVMRAALDEGLLVFSAGAKPDEAPPAASGQHHERRARERLREARQGLRRVAEERARC